MFKKALLIALATVFAVALNVAPSFAAGFNPTITILTPTIIGNPTSPHVIQGYITMSASDTYATGGFVLTPSQLGALNYVNEIMFTSAINYGWTPVVAPGPTTGSQTVTFQQPVQGTSSVAAAATTKTVTVAPATGQALSANTVIECALDDAATGGGGTGTWAVTDAVSSCKEASATTFTLTAIAAAPTGGGNFTYFIPGVYQELPTATAIGNDVLYFTAVVQ